MRLKRGCVGVWVWRQVRRAQRRYVEIWVNLLRDVNTRLDEDRARVAKEGELDLGAYGELVAHGQG